jgi:hypothetical protein
MKSVLTLSIFFRGLATVGIGRLLLVDRGLVAFRANLFGFSSFFLAYCFTRAASFSRNSLLRR